MVGTIDTGRPAIDRWAAWQVHSLQTRPDRAIENGGDAGSFHRLFQRGSGLERLIADAGPLGKFKTDPPDQMPSGTSALTLRVGDALNRIAARLGLPVERILPGEHARSPAVLLRPAPELPPGHGPTAAAPAHGALDPRPAVAVDAGNHVRAPDRARDRW
jgi:hypothetical protein